MLDKRLSKILINRKINIQMNKELHKLANDEARWERIDKKLNKRNNINYNCKIKYNKVNPNKDVIYVVGDFHYRGSQDDDLIKNCFLGIIKDVKERKYQHVQLWLTGDNVDGEIHEEQTRTNEPVIDTAIRLIDLFCFYIPRIPNLTTVNLVYGNHEELRLWGDKNTENNVGKFIGHGLRAGISSNIDVYHGEELYFSYKGKGCVLIHGHQGWAKSKAKIIEHCVVKYGYIPDMIVLGHFHTSKANQFSKNHWLITAPAVKNWTSRWDETNGFCGLGQYIKLKINQDTPQITTINV